MGHLFLWPGGGVVEGGGVTFTIISRTLASVFLLLIYLFETDTQIYMVPHGICEEKKKIFAKKQKSFLKHQDVSGLNN